MTPTRLVRATTLALVALTALSLTGCRPGSGKNGKKRHRSSSSDYRSSHRNGGFGSGSSSHRRSSSSHKNRGTVVRDCTGSSLRLTVEPVSRPAHRFLVKAVNVSGRTCELEGYPRIRFDGVRQAPDVVNGNRRLSDIDLHPNAAAYAAVQTAGASGSGGTSVRDVEVAVLADNKLDVLGAPVRIRLPRGTGVGGTAVGYWWPTTSGALTW